VTDETRTLVRYRLSRAKEALEEAILLLESDHTNTFVNRLYYACFYAVSALLLAKGLSATRHSGGQGAVPSAHCETGLVEHLPGADLR
jgi:uncharacterized protein